MTSILGEFSMTGGSDAKPGTEDDCDH